MAKEDYKDDSYNADSCLEERESDGYGIVTFEMRAKLLKMVIISGEKIIKASEILNINESTAKYIVRTFLKKGKILLKFDQNQSLADESIQKELDDLNKIKERMNIKTQPRKPLKSRKRKSSKQNKVFIENQEEQKASNEIETLKDKVSQEGIQTDVRLEENSLFESEIGNGESIPMLSYWPWCYGAYPSGTPFIWVAYGESNFY